MENNGLDDRIYSVLSEALKEDINQEKFGTETALLDLGLNSMSFVRLGVLLEEEFDISFTLSELEFESNHFDTIAALIESIKGKISMTKKNNKDNKDK